MQRKPIPFDAVNMLSRVNAELLRRNGNGDLSGNAGITFAVQPEVGESIRQEHYKKSYDALKIINPTAIPELDFVGIDLEDIETLEMFISLYEFQPRDAIEHSDCAAACSGMCVTICTTSCGGSCSGTCKGGCTGGCSGCGGACSYNCTSCSGTCAGSCVGDCTGTCSGTCVGGCTNNCKGCGPCTGCYTGCEGCKGSCSGSCVGGCTGTCSGSCMGTSKGGVE